MRHSAMRAASDERFYSSGDEQRPQSEAHEPLPWQRRSNMADAGLHRAMLQGGAAAPVQGAPRSLVLLYHVLVWPLSAAGAAYSFWSGRLAVDTCSHGARHFYLSVRPCESSL